MVILFSRLSLFSKGTSSACPLDGKFHGTFLYTDFIPIIKNDVMGGDAGTLGWREGLIGRGGSVVPGPGVRDGPLALLPNSECGCLARSLGTGVGAGTSGSGLSLWGRHYKMMQV